MNFKEKISVLLIPHQKGRIREIKISPRTLVLLLVGATLVLSSCLFFSLSGVGGVVDKLKLSRLEKKNELLQAKLDEMNSTISSLQGQMAELIEKEQQVRMVFGLPEVDPQIRELGVGGPMPENQDYTDQDFEELYLAETQLDKLLRQAKFEKDNFEEIYSSLSDRKKTLDHTPSIRPSSGYLSCGFGMRVDPFTGRRVLHRGVDLAADIGTPVHVTADGVVSKVKRDVGLGKLIEVNHGYGYKTVYAHLSRISVKRGQHLSRGELIGAVGNTGYSTGPHLHYEVHFQGRARNPLRYFLVSEYLVD
jgi:murein DD-endopeptidase MepM/ murein hydrolase activator NlpD